MGHRALVAVETAAGRYALSHSQWGGAALTDRTASLESTVTGAVERGRVLDTDCSVTDVIDAIDPVEYEALLVADCERHVEAFLVVSLAVVSASEEPTALDSARWPFALVPFVDAGQARRLRAFVRTIAGTLGDAVDAGVLDRGRARRVLRYRLAAHPDVTSEVVWHRPE